MEIHKMLTLSTSHISKETAQLFDAFELPFDLCIYDKRAGLDHYGWFLTDWSLSQGMNIPHDLFACFRVAEENGCDWLCLDCDGEVLKHLPVYEW